MIFVKTIGFFLKETGWNKIKTEGCQVSQSGRRAGDFAFRTGVQRQAQVDFPPAIHYTDRAARDGARGAGPQKKPGSGSGDHVAALGEYAQPDKNQITGCSADGSAPALGAGCRRFESCHSDQKRLISVEISRFPHFLEFYSKLCCLLHL